MKAIMILVLIIFMTGCKTQQSTSSANKDTVRIANDELEYEVIIIDPGFTSWLKTRARPRNYHSQQFLEEKNRIWIIEWNNRVQQPMYNNLYQMTIDYDRNIDYGYEVNYLLYNYLVYFQITNNQRLGGFVPEI